MPHRLRCDHPGSWHHVFARLNVIAYIDANAVQAGLAATPEAYPHGSARFWGGRACRPGLRRTTSRGSWGSTVRGLRGPGRPLARVLRVALLRDLAGLRYAAIAQRCGTSITEAHTCYRQHAARLLEDPSYAGACGSIARATLVILHRPRPRAR